MEQRPCAPGATIFTRAWVASKKGSSARTLLGHGNLAGEGGEATRKQVQTWGGGLLDCVVVWVVVEVVLDDVTESGVVVPAGIPETLLMGGLGVVNLFVVTMEDEELLLGFGGQWEASEARYGGVVTKLVLIQVLVVDLCVLGKTVLMGVVPGLIELGAAVWLVGECPEWK